MSQRRLGKEGPAVASVGYGAMVLEGYYGPVSDETATEALSRAIDLGMMIDTADAYGEGHNESLIGQTLKASKQKAFVATKFGIAFEGEGTAFPTGWGFSLTLNGKPGYAVKAIDASLGRLGLDCVDLWYLHFPDPSVAIEETVGAMAKAVKAGKAKHLGLCNVNAEQVRRAHAVHPIAAVQVEYSLWRREAEADLLPSLRELGIALVAWSPLGSGFLAGNGESPPEGDFRRNNPRFSDRNLDANKNRFAPVLALAGNLGITPAQLSLAWLLHQGTDIIPIPGTRKAERILENARAARVILDDSLVGRISHLAAPGLAQGRTLI
ncbi:MAG: aldo/keto reductase [Rhodospirillales bacterium]|nr:MAG: aldo/keto reductase [Rhodospirillales bacterium]